MCLENVWSDGVRLTRSPCWRNEAFMLFLSKLAPAEKDYSVRSACMGSMYAALRAGINAAINPIAESVTATAT